jgi:dipeptidase
MSKGEGGEALTVIDKNEAWVFHVLADDTGTSAVWAAQRLQEGYVSLSTF